ncbi:hypothetical protein T492DRAFT_1150455 [Pavlovales sp. CCMP2436]|nr:hypothetical protein T492DRAFT_1150455 [Pavlovales sp. CCMP2436]
MSKRLRTMETMLEALTAKLSESDERLEDAEERLERAESGAARGIMGDVEALLESDLGKRVESLEDVVERVDALEYNSDNVIKDWVVMVNQFELAVLKCRLGAFRRHYLEDQGEPFDSWAEWLSEMYHKEDCIRRLNPPVPPRAEMEQPGGLHDVSAIHCSLIRNAAPSAQILPLSKLVALVFGAS